MSGAAATNASAKLVVTLVPLMFGALAVVFDQDANWDLRNYHWYNVYAFLNDRLGFDVGAAQTATYYNPLLDLPFYWLATHSPARVAGFVLGVVQGLNFVLLYFIAIQLSPALQGRSRVVTGSMIALVGVVGGGNLGLIGTTYNDNVVSLFVLGALLIVIAVGPPRADRGGAGEKKWALPVAGFIVGCGVGLKLPTVVYAIGLCGALLFLAAPPRQRILRSIVFGLGVLAGIATTGGAWFTRLWLEFGNPVFPYFNQVIQSPMALPESYRDTRFLPSGIWRTLGFPLVFSNNPFTVGESAFRDYRIVTAYVLILVMAAAKVFRRLFNAPAAMPLDNTTRYVIASCAISYAAWLKMFAIYRYALVLEMLAPLLIVIAANTLPMAPRYRGAFVGVLLLALTVTARPGDWGRTPWPSTPAGAFVRVQAPQLPHPDHTLIVMTGLTPTAFVIPAFPAAIPFLRVHSYLIHPDHGPTGLNRRMASRIAAHDGDLYWLVAEWERDEGPTILAAYGLRADRARCETIVTNLASGILLCPLARVATPPPHP